MNRPSVRKYGPRGVLMEWESTISPEIHQQVIRTSNFLKENHQDWILEIVPSYSSLVVFLKDSADLRRSIDICQHVNIPTVKDEQKHTIWLVPVCYDLSFGYDLEMISKSTDLSVESIIKLHCKAAYHIYAMGFLPGFLYLGGLNEQLHFPRKSVVDQLVPKGAVAIGGEQTGIYPQKSPGGWNIIGRTPIDLFNPELDRPTPFFVGDSIQFVPVNLEEYDEIQSQVNRGEYELKFVIDD